jgi:hypothetical protein
MGVGAGFLRWVKLLLANTGACALVNGYVSPKYAYTAGVRQGCPLSPQLYLFVAQAMLSFLRAQGFGTQVSGRSLVATQYADDAQVFLSSAAEVPRFLAVMATFKAASGQGLNVDKTLVLILGKAARLRFWEEHFAALHGPQQSHAMAVQELQQDRAAIPPACTVHGLKVVRSAKALGITFCGTGAVEVDWQSLLDKVLKVYGFIAKLPLSMFGRAFAAAGYGISKMLYCAEFTGMPPPLIIRQLEKASSKLVDRHLPPDSAVRRFPGIAGDLLAGHPSTGGVGAMPWKQHIQARHAMWGVRLILGHSTVPWVHVARSLLVPPGITCPAWCHLGIAMCRSPQFGPTGLPLPLALRRLIGGLLALPTWRDIQPLNMPLGMWCKDAPLWCNPFLVQGPGLGMPRPLPRHGLEMLFADLAQMPTMRTISHAMTALEEVRNASSTEAYRQQIWPFWLQRDPRFSDRQQAEDRLQALVDSLPITWRLAAIGVGGGAPLPIPSPQVLVQTYILDRLGWTHPTRPSHCVSLSQLTVKLATQLQLQPILDAREAKHFAFCSQACLGLPANLQAQPIELLRVLRRLWCLPWDNQRKEFFWRFTVDGLPTAARMHMFGEPCAVCHNLAPGRRHHYWECPVAAAVVTELQRGLAGFGGEPLRCDHVWLARPPSPQLHKGLWLVVCQAALLGMDKGRKLMVATTLNAQDQHRGLQSLPGPAQLQVVCRVAAATFWDMLADFVGLGLAPVTWLAEVHSQHPFLGVQTAADGRRSLVLRRV